MISKNINKNFLFFFFNELKNYSIHLTQLSSSGKSKQIYYDLILIIQTMIFFYHIFHKQSFLLWHKHQNFLHIFRTFRNYLCCQSYCLIYMLLELPNELNLYAPWIFFKSFILSLFWVREINFLPKSINFRSIIVSYNIIKLFLTNLSDSCSIV